MRTHAISSPRGATRRAVTAVAALAALLGATVACSDPSTSLPSGATVLAANAVVERVVDGDTIVIEIEGRSERLRLIGIDTPESVKPNSPVECFGVEASDHTKSLLPEGTAVRVERDVEARDDFDRLLGYVYRATDGLFVNEAIVADGYALPLTIPPNVAYSDLFVAASRRAQASGIGLWASCPAS